MEMEIARGGGGGVKLYEESGLETVWGDDERTDEVKM